MAEPERASYLTELPDNLPDDCRRLYYGTEFCFWRLPTVDNILNVKAWASRFGIPLTFVTPVLGESERQRLAIVLRAVLPALANKDEVVISDWGALQLVRSVNKDVEVVLGRALSGQKRGPRILDMELNLQQLDYFQRGSWFSREGAALLADHGIKRVELDNLLQGLAPLPAGLTGSLHLPYAMVSSSRNCPYREAKEAGPCAVHCGQVFTLMSSETDMPLYQDGNTQFIRNDSCPENLPELGFDRLVCSPPF